MDAGRSILLMAIIFFICCDTFLAKPVEWKMQKVLQNMRVLQSSSNKKKDDENEDVEYKKKKDDENEDEEYKKERWFPFHPFHSKTISRIVKMEYSCGEKKWKGIISWLLESSPPERSFFLRFIPPREKGLEESEREDQKALAEELIKKCRERGLRGSRATFTGYKRGGETYRKMFCFRVKMFRFRVKITSEQIMGGKKVEHRLTGGKSWENIE